MRRFTLRVLALLVLSPLVLAIGGKTFSWQPPSGRMPDENGVIEVLPNSEIAEYRIYCDGSSTPIWIQLNEPLNTDTWAAPDGTFALGSHSCFASVVDVEGQESDMSNTVNFIVSRERPQAPVFAVQ